MNQDVTFDLPPISDATPIATSYQADPSQGPRPGDEKLYVKFYKRPTQDGAASNAAGRPIFREVDYVRIHIPGDKNNVVDTKVNDSYRARFPRQWQQFQMALQGAESTPEGTLLTEWAQMTRSQAEEFKYMHVYTVEQLATLPDGFGSRVMGFYDLRIKARSFLERAKDDAFAEKIAVENDELKKRIAALEAMVQNNQAAKKEPKREPARSGPGGE